MTALWALREREEGVCSAEAEGKEQPPRDNEVSYVANTVDLPNVQTVQNVQGNLLRADVAIRSRFLNSITSVLIKGNSRKLQQRLPPFSSGDPLCRAVDLCS